MHQEALRAEQENAMYALDVVLGMTLFRVILPVALLLMVGEWANRRVRRLYGRR